MPALLPPIFAFALALAPVFTKGPYLQAVTPTSADVVVELDPPGAAEVEVGTPAVHLVQSEVRSLHRFHVTGLLSAHRYDYVVRAASSTTGGHLTTAPDPSLTPAAPFSFVVYGDSRTDDAAHASMAYLIEKTPGDFLLDTGDLVSDGASAADWQTFFHIEGTVLRDRCLFVCVGNHELTERSGANYLAYFAPGELGCGGPGRPCEATNELYGSFRWANTRFFLLNGMDDFSTGAEREWLASELDRAEGEAGLVFRIVVVHWGPFSSGPHGDNLRLHGAHIPELLRQHHVDLVLSGHDHLYERGTDDGLKYIISGGGGAPLYHDIKPRPSTRRVEATHHVVRIEIDGRSVRTRTIRGEEATILETCGFDKPGDEIRDWSCDGAVPVASGGAGADAMAASVDAAPATPPSPPPKRASGCGCDLVGLPRSSAGGAGATLFFVFIAVLGALRRAGRRRRDPS